MVIIEEYGPEEMLKRLSDPYWFQAFGCVLGFDWHSSGLTTTVGGALKEGLRDVELEIGFFVAGGKGGTSRKTPQEIETVSERTGIDAKPLVYASRMAAKVDSAALQDGFELYHHNFFHTSSGRWCVVQQGMNKENRYARRYHWLGDKVSDFVCEPHAAVCCDFQTAVLNMVHRESEKARQRSVVISRHDPDRTFHELEAIVRLDMPRRHGIREEFDIDPKRFHKVLLKTYEYQPNGFETLLSMQGIGPKTIRALTLMSELIYGERPSYQDPVRYSYAHGGKDGFPYPVDRKTYDQSIDCLRLALDRSKIDRSERIHALKRLVAFYDSRSPQRNQNRVTGGLP